MITVEMLDQFTVHDELARRSVVFGRGLSSLEFCAVDKIATDQMMTTPHAGVIWNGGYATVSLCPSWAHSATTKEALWALVRILREKDAESGDCPPAFFWILGRNCGMGDATQSLFYLLPTEFEAVSILAPLNRPGISFGLLHGFPALRRVLKFS